MKKIVIISIAIVILLMSFVYADFKVPQQPQNYLNDYAGVLNAGQRQALNIFLKNYELKTTNQIFVGIFDSLKGENLEDLSIQIAEKWKPGLKDKDNGVLLLIFLKERKIRIEVGYGLEPVLTDALSKAVIANEITPKFRAGNYYAGVKGALYQMAGILSASISKEDLEYYAHRAQRVGAKKGNPILSLVFLIFFIFLFIRHPFLALLLFSGGFSSGGRYSGGGFFGGGGGSFGGGGASGSW